ncbi:hypothetical protein BGZ83_000212 [Gryganskiella cystojenkinii]|nr:hypothetical protein BGZ83_000212 [Gryganskiella cystojenkinii]
MTVPTDSTSSHGGKVQPLTSLPMPKLPSESQSHAKANSNLKTTSRSAAGASSNSGQNSLLSSWLSNGNRGYASPSLSASSTAAPPTFGTHAESGVSKIESKGDHHAGSELGSEAESMDVDDAELHQPDQDPSAAPPTSTSPVSKGKRGRKAKAKAETTRDSDQTTATKTQKAPKEPKEPKERKIKESKAPSSKEPTQTKKMTIFSSGGEETTSATGTSSAAAASGTKADRSILSFFDRSKSTTPKVVSTAQPVVEEQSLTEISAPSNNTSSVKTPFKQSCLQFDKLDPSKAESYFASMAAASVEEDKRFGSLLKELPKLVGRAPYEDLLDGLIMRSSNLPSIHKLDLHRPDLNMDMLADVKMVHEFLNTFGSPLGLTRDSGEWITYDALLGMIRNPRVDNRLLDLNCKMIIAAYEEDKSPAINNFNFPYFLAVGPTTAEDKKEQKKNKLSSVSAKRKIVPQNRLAMTEYSFYSVSDRIEALVKALHDITSSDRFHRFMRNKVEENITSLKRHKRKRAEVRKELETQTHELEKEMRTLEYDATLLETQRQSILSAERETADAEEESGSGGGGRTSSSRLQKLAHTKDARNKANELLIQERALTAELKAKEAIWEVKKEELDNISLDDRELQKEHNVPMSQLRGGQAVNTDEKLRVISLGSDRWGRKYWFWRNFGGIIVEDRKQLGPKIKDTATGKSIDSEIEEDHKPEKAEQKDNADATMADVTERMKAMANPDLTGQTTPPTTDATPSDNLSSKETDGSEEPSSPSVESVKPTVAAAVAPKRDVLDYGQINTWGLISTPKELVSLTRALNGKGVREKYLKASLVTMRKEIEASFQLIPSWIGREVVVQNDKTITAMAGIGQPLSEHDLMALMKKRGRKSRQELADIAATQMVQAASEDQQGMDVDMPASSAATEVENNEQDESMVLDDEQSEQSHEAGGSIPEESESCASVGFLRVVHDTSSGPTPSEYYDSLVKAAEERLHDLSKTICEVENNAILEAVERSLQDAAGDRLAVTVRVLQQCLLAMDQVEVLEDDKDKKMVEADPSTVIATEPEPVPTTETTSTSADAAMEIAVEKQSGSALSDADQIIPVLQCSVPVTVNPRLLVWLRACHVEVMLKSVRTYGALHAWLDDCLYSISNKVDEAEEGGDETEENEDESDREKEPHEEDEADHDEQDDEDDEDDDDEEHGHDEDEAEEPRNHKSQNSKNSKNRADETDNKSRGRERKSQQETEMRFSNVGGRSLRARGSQPVSYKDDLHGLDDDEDGEEDEDATVEEDEEEEEDDDEDEDEGRGSRLRRSKRMRH